MNKVQKRAKNVSELGTFVSSKCVSTESERMDVLLHLLCTAFYINMRGGSLFQ